jgi:hypothetical protein
LEIVKPLLNFPHHYPFRKVAFLHYALNSTQGNNLFKTTTYINPTNPVPEKHPVLVRF